MEKIRWITMVKSYEIHTEGRGFPDRGMPFCLFSFGCIKFRF
jgi:hypothetical protein